MDEFHIVLTLSAGCRRRKPRRDDVTPLCLVHLFSLEFRREVISNLITTYNGFWFTSENTNCLLCEEGNFFLPSSSLLHSWWEEFSEGMRSLSSNQGYMQNGVVLCANVRILAVVSVTWTVEVEKQLRRRWAQAQNIKCKDRMMARVRGKQKSW